IPSLLRGDLAGRLAATQKNSLKGRAREPTQGARLEGRMLSRFFVARGRSGHGSCAMSDKPTEPGTPAWSPETLLVHGGTLRSPFGETSEAMFLTQSFVYATAEQAEARFKDEDPGFIYSRFSNPTTTMFEERMRLLEGAEAARATATGMAAV